MYSLVKTYVLCRYIRTGKERIPVNNPGFHPHHISLPGNQEFFA